MRDSPNPSPSSPHAVFFASIKQLKQVILVYSDYPESRYDIWWHISVMYVANASVKGFQADPEWRSYFLLCLYCYSILMRCFCMVQWIVPGLLAIAVQSGAMSSMEAQYIKSHFRSREVWGIRPAGSGAGFVLDMDRAASDVSSPHSTRSIIPYWLLPEPVRDIFHAERLCWYKQLMLVTPTDELPC